MDVTCVLSVTEWKMTSELVVELHDSFCVRSPEFQSVAKLRRNDGLRRTIERTSADV